MLSVYVKKKKTQTPVHLFGESDASSKRLKPNTKLLLK